MLRKSFIQTAKLPISGHPLQSQNIRYGLPAIPLRGQSGACFSVSSSTAQRNLLLIADSVFVDFIQPEIRSCLRHFEEATTVAVPEAPVNKNDRLMLREYQVWLTGELISMNAETKASGMQSLPDEDFGRGVFALYPGHHPGAGCHINYVGQEKPPLRTGQAPG
jgi:hypothetical protein